MYLIDIFPIVKGTWSKGLQYWSAAHISPGSIVYAPLKGKQVAGFVYGCTPLKEAKHIVKEAEFKTRKIEQAEPVSVVPHTYIHAVFATAGYFVQHPGSMLKTTIPTCAFASEHKNKNLDLDPNQATLTTDLSTKKSDVVAISTQMDDRISFYKSIVREEVAKNKSVVLVAPTVRAADHLFHSMKKGIEHITYILHSGHTKKQLEQKWQEISTASRGMVLIVTPQFISIPRTDIETIILEHESSRAYKTFHPPYFDWRFLIETYAKEIKARLILGDQLLRLETIIRVQNQEIHELFPLSYRIQKDAEVIIVDMSEDRKKNNTYRMLSEELVSMVEYAQKKKQQLFLFTARRGLSPQTVCGDCHETVSCEHCHAPVVLHNSKKQGRYFLCHHCGRERSALEACKKCQSWNLTTLGVGSDAVEQELKARYPHIPIFRLDKDVAHTDKAAQKIIEGFKKTEGAILIGTETALSYLDEVKHVAVVSMESLFSIPDFRIHERIVHMYLRLLEITGSYLLIQSKSTDTPIIQGLVQKNLSEYVRSELHMRKILNYPPYTIMGKIILKGAEQDISKKAKFIQETLKDCDPQIFPAMIPSADGPTINIIFTLPQNTWAPPHHLQTELYKSLDMISRIAYVQINPESFI